MSVLLLFFFEFLDMVIEIVAFLVFVFSVSVVGAIGVVAGYGIGMPVVVRLHVAFAMTGKY